MSLTYGNKSGKSHIGVPRMMPSLIRDLSDPASLPDRTKSVSVIQTHISIVLVGDEYVYKIKKAVHFGFLDFLSLEKRAYYCEQELRLNKRLAEDIYISVIPIRFDGKKFTMLGSAGDEIREYAVKMRRIPEELLMKSLYEKGALIGEHLKKVAGVLASFHSSASRSAEIDQYGTPERFKVNTDENFDQVRKYVGVTIGSEEFNALETWTESFYKSSRHLFFNRIREGKIRDCHGDLHMEHICFTQPLSIIDCIEFNDRFRYSDAVADIAFLLMDLEYHGGAPLAARLWRDYTETAGDEGVESLLTFYKVYRAFVRGKVNSFQGEDSAMGRDEKEKALERAKKYFKLAYSYI
jgi:uncharacterized protein